MQSYAFKDCPSTGKNYYRLKQVDRDGQFSLSPLRAVQVEGEQLQILLTLEGVGIISTESTETKLVIYSELGQELVQKQLQLSANIYYHISVDLQNGIYLFHLSSTDKEIWKKVAVQR